ncbi:DNA polymerase delta subunit 2 [Acrasis kona]|uniref:DNA polymerase delta subunit 2 n=1 Tax=Acrasis kona TaxID=1008807 RepID=A0AAW2YWF6_9EUKA
MVKRKSEQFLKEPSKNEQSSVLTRSEYEYSNSVSKEKYILQNKSFNQQFSHLYLVRLSQLKDRVTKRAISHLGNKQADIAKRIMYLNEEGANIVVGTLYKDMKLKPNILLEYTKERYIDADIPKTVSDIEEEDGVTKHRITPEDVFVLEDETGRIKLILDEVKDKHKQLLNDLVTGVIIAVLGEQDHNGHLVVKDIILHDLPKQSPQKSLNEDAYVALVSGLLIGSPKSNILSMQTMIDYICGVVGGSEDHEQSAKIIRVIFAGDSVSAPDRMEGEIFGVRGSLRHKEKQSLVERMKQMDSLVKQLCASVDVDIMPGEQDPANGTQPQQPLHPSMLPESSRFTSTHLTCNPYAFTLNGCNFLGTSGQNIEDVKKYSNCDSSIEIMESMMRWAHIAPTAPDTLNCYAFEEMDPFVIDETPHVFFAGNQNAYETKKIEGVNGAKSLLISLPCFAKEPMIVLVNIRTLECHPVKFNINSEYI